VFVRETNKFEDGTDILTIDNKMTENTKLALEGLQALSMLTSLQTRQRSCLSAK
jgi:hypothetical protein